MQCQHVREAQGLYAPADPGTRKPDGHGDGGGGDNCLLDVADGDAVQHGRARWLRDALKSGDDGAEDDHHPVGEAELLRRHRKREGREHSDGVDDQQ